MTCTEHLLHRHQDVPFSFFLAEERRLSLGKPRANGKVVSGSIRAFPAPHPRKITSSASVGYYGGITLFSGQHLGAYPAEYTCRYLCPRYLHATGHCHEPARRPGSRRGGQAESDDPSERTPHQPCGITPINRQARAGGLVAFALTGSAAPSYLDKVRSRDPCLQLLRGSSSSGPLLSSPLAPPLPAKGGGRRDRALPCLTHPTSSA